MFIRFKLYLKDFGSFIVEEFVDYGGYLMFFSEMCFFDVCLVVDVLLELVLMG